VNPNATDGEAERKRNQIIQESKFLGGDMEHTHLVKGLDYALLQKVKAEIVFKETESVDAQQENSHVQKSESGNDSHEVKIEGRSALAKNIHRTLFQELPEKNELFQPGRMAYLVELEDDFADSDVPTTVVRSKVDCPTISEMSAASSTNDLVVNKLIQILAYLRQGGRGKKWRKRWAASSKDEKTSDPASELGIFGELENTLAKGVSNSAGGSGGQMTAKVHCNSRDEGRSEVGRKEEREHERGQDERRDPSRKRENRVRFARNEKDDEEYRQSMREEQPTKSAAEMIKDINDKFGQQSDSSLKSKAAKIIKKQSSDCYSECYPGMECDVVDSDDEVDYTKMDQGNKKGPVGRWDFETTEEYSDYMHTKEAMPKAAFQFGVKMADGRKTRRVKPQNERQKLEREWKQISQILEKRRRPEGDDGAKRSKY